MRLIVLFIYIYIIYIYILYICLFTSKCTYVYDVYAIRLHSAAGCLPKGFMLPVDDVRSCGCVKHGNPKWPINCLRGLKCYCHAFWWYGPLFSTPYSKHIPTMCFLVNPTPCKSHLVAVGPWVPKPPTGDGHRWGVGWIQGLKMMRFSKNSTLW